MTFVEHIYKLQNIYNAWKISVYKYKSQEIPREYRSIHSERKIDSEIIYMYRLEVGTYVLVFLRPLSI